MTIGIIGCGFWAGYQVAAWREVDPSLYFAFCDRDRAKAVAMAKRFGGGAVYDDASRMLDETRPDLADIITGPETHAALAGLARERAIPIICQKPLAPDEATASAMVADCSAAGVSLYVHENFRWQPPIRHLKKLLDGGEIGKPFRARLFFNSSFPVFDNQPTLAGLDRFLLADLGVHLLDICRFLFGEAKSVYCLTRRVNPTIRGEDVANVLLEMQSGMTCSIELSYASVVDYECFPQTLAEVEGEQGSIRLLPDYEYTVTTRGGHRRESITLPDYGWVHPQYAVAQSAMVGIHRQFLSGLMNGEAVETTGEDNLRTLALTYAAYRSAEEGRVVPIASGVD